MAWGTIDTGWGAKSAEKKMLSRKKSIRKENQRKEERLNVLNCQQIIYIGGHSAKRNYSTFCQKNLKTDIRIIV